MKISFVNVDPFSYFHSQFKRSLCFCLDQTNLKMIDRGLCLSASNNSFIRVCQRNPRYVCSIHLFLAVDYAHFFLARKNQIRCSENTVLTPFLRRLLWIINHHEQICTRLSQHFLVAIRCGGEMSESKRRLISGLLKMTEMFSEISY